MRMKSLTLIACCAVLVFAGAVSAQVDELFRDLPMTFEDLPSEAQDYLLGLGPEMYGLNLVTTIIPANSFHPTDSAITFARDTSHYRYSTGGPTPSWYEAGVGPEQGIPFGAFVVSACNFAFDVDMFGEIQVKFFGVEHAWFGTDTPGFHRFGNVGVTGVTAMPAYGGVCTAPLTTLVAHADITNDGDENFLYYVLRVELTNLGSALRFGGGMILWNRQISPAPPTASFTDVPTSHWAFQHVEALKSSGITTGCSATQFCPDQTLTRAQMAVFLAKALGLYWPQ